ncbi:MAG: DUF4956 domain-containing protein [Clostridia bacterium]|nr:DUF4956 domain-containing protein [Clostridia bacterium]
MLDNLFRGIFDSSLMSVIPVYQFLLCVGCSLAVGLILAGMYAYRAKYTKSFVATLALLPAVVCVVIMMVNGNVGAGVAVAGTFSLVRFRSVPGSAREIGAIFLAMASGLIAGMGYLAYSALFAIVVGAAGMVYNHFDFGARRNGEIYKTLHITIPEDLDYSGVFEQVFRDYTSKWELVSVKTTNMGSLFRLTYDITLRGAGVEKELIDKLRCRNGNLEITVSRQETTLAEL